MASANVYGTLANGDSVPLTRGMVVRVSTTTNSIVRAQADAAPNLQGLAGVVDSGNVGVGARATNVVATSLNQLVLLETGLTPAVGDTLYVSETVAGRATNVAPTIAVVVGTIRAVGQYSNNSLVAAGVIPAGSVAGGSSSGSGALVARAFADSNITLSGAQTIDDVAVVADDLVIVNGQTDASENGYYVVGTPWVRSSRFDDASEMTAGKLFTVTEGTNYADSIWMFATTGVVDPGVTDVSFSLLGPTFGADVTVDVANSNGDLVHALNLVADLAISTPGGEYSRWDWNMLVAGVITPAYGFQSNALFAPDLIFFLSDIDTGFSHNGTDACKIVCGGNQIVNFAGTGVEIAAGLALRLSGNGAQVARDGGTGTVSLVPDTASGNVQLGLTSLATTATHGFPCMPAFAGAPTGVVTPPAGMVAYALNTSNGHIYTTVGGGVWVDSSV